MVKIAMLGAGLIGESYTKALHNYPSDGQVSMVYSQTHARAAQFAQAWNIPRWSTDMREAINDPDTDFVIIGLPNHMHEEAVLLSAEAGKAVLCTKPLGRDAAEARRMLQAVENAGVFHGYLEDLAYPPKTLRALESVSKGAIGRVIWVRSRGTHAGPHSKWFKQKTLAGGGAIIDMGSHCIEVGRNFIGKSVKPLEVMCWADTQIHPIEAEDTTVGIVRYETGAVAQFEAGWTFRGGMDLRDEVSGTEGTIWLNHWQRTGFEMFSAIGEDGGLDEKSEGEIGWSFPVAGDAIVLGRMTMFADMFQAYQSGTAPMETFYDGYVVNAIIDAAYKSVASKRWEPIHLKDWPDSNVPKD